MSSILDFLKPKHNLEKYKQTLLEEGRVDISRLDIEERLKLVSMIKKEHPDIKLDYEYPDKKTHDKVVLVVKK